MSNIPPSLRYSSDDEPGFSARLQGKLRLFFDVAGDEIEDEKCLSRLTALGIPPAYTDIWICKNANGHLQMTGRDDAGRKQYRYHKDWRRFRNLEKYSALSDFGEALPSLRRRIARDLRREDVDRRFVTAALLRLIDAAALRVGNPSYTEQNGSYGATTLRQKHIKLSGNSVRLDFRAKGGKRVRKIIRDKTLNRVIESIHDLPGREIFQYVGRDEKIRALDSSQVNDYIGDPFTAKTFRTWHGTIAAYGAAEKASGRLTLKAMAEAAAARLHNTPAICRSSYIHPAVTALADLGSDERNTAFAELRNNTKRVAKLRAREARCLRLIQA